MTTPSMKPIVHCKARADALRLNQFLIDTYALMGRDFNWETRRWEGSYWCVSDADLHRSNLGRTYATLGNRRRADRRRGDSRWPRRCRDPDSPALSRPGR